MARVHVVKGHVARADRHLAPEMAEIVSPAAATVAAAEPATSARARH